MEKLFDETVLPEVTFGFSGKGTEGWRPVHVHLREGLSRLYEGSLVLAHPAGSGADAPRGMLGQSLVLEIRRGGVTRRFCGFVRKVQDLGSTGAYRFARVVMVPTLWRLSQRVDARIFQDLNVVEIAREVLLDAGVYQGDAGLWVGIALESLAPREYCVQYQESDLDFVMRLLEDEGIPFYFRHAGATETLVLAEDDHEWVPVTTMDGRAEVSILDAGTGTAAVETLQWFDVRELDHGTGVVLRDYDFTHPAVEAGMSPRFPLGAAGDRHTYEYRGTFTLGEYDEGARVYGPHEGGRFARVRHEAMVHDAVTGHGRSVVSGMTPGFCFDLSGHESQERDLRWLVTGVEQQGVAWGDITDDVRASEHVRAILRETGAEVADDRAQTALQARYWNTFTCTPATVVFRPPRVTTRSRVHGPQTARVVAEPGSGEEICVDSHGRVLVRFHWERPERRTTSQREKRHSCWIRVAQTWAGPQWGTMFIPRVGMEVVVQFLEGDPDRPLVTGCVYNGENGAPYPLPQEKTKSTIKTSSSPASGGYNELRFEDAAGQEQIYVQAERDYDALVKHDETLTVGHDETLTVGRDRTKTVMHDERNTVSNNRSTSIGANDSLVVEQNAEVEVHGSVGATVTVDENLILKAGETVVVTVGASRLTMTRDTMTLQSLIVRIFGEECVDIRGGKVKLNCAPPEIVKTTDHEGGFVVKDAKGRPRADVPYVIRTSKGREIRDVTDENGRTRLVRTESAEPIQIKVLGREDCGS